jgi:signal transduction histidine kinase
MKGRLLHLLLRSDQEDLAGADWKAWDVTRLVSPSREELLDTLERGSFDVVIISMESYVIGDGATAELLNRAPDIPCIIVTRALSPVDSINLPPNLWAVISSDDVLALPLCVQRAMQHSQLRRTSSAAESELARARNLLRNNQKSISLGRLLGSIAHEINNPLEAMANLLYLAQQSSPRDQHIVAAEEELKRVADITRQMLTFYRESRDVQEIPAVEMLEDLLALFSAKLKRHKINVVRQYRSNGHFIAYPGELRQAFSNIVSNAIDAMPGGGRLTVRVRETRGSHPRLCVSIADTGTGMSPDVRRHLGELFFTTKGDAGTGLGMWLTYQLIEKYAAVLRIYSSVKAQRTGSVLRLCFKEPHIRLLPAAETNVIRVRTPAAASSKRQKMPDGAAGTTQIA